MEDILVANEQQPELNDQMKARREKMDALREAGIDPFGHRFERTHLAQELHDQFDAMDHDAVLADETHVKIAGRMMSKRGKGKVGFAIFAIAQARFNCMCAKTWSAKTTIRSSKKPILAIS